jgi:signal transduction histidine kinase
MPPAPPQDHLKVTGEFLTPTTKPARAGWRPGLRLMLALGLGFVILIALLLISLLVFGLIRRTTARSHTHHADHLARALLTTHPDLTQSTLQAWVDAGVVEAAWLSLTPAEGLPPLTLRAGPVSGPAPQTPFDGTSIYGVSHLDARSLTVRLPMLPLTQSLSTAQALSALYLPLIGLGLLLLAFLILTRLLINPIRDLVLATERVTRGDLSVRARARGAGELADLSEHFNRMIEAVSQMVDEVVQQRAALAESVVDLRRTNSSLQRANLNLQRAQRDLQTSQEHLIRAERLATIGQLAAGVAHEIGNPLSSLLAYLDLLSDPENTPAEHLDLTSRALDATQRIHRTIRELLDYSRARPDSLELLDPVPAIHQALRLVEPQKRLRGVRLTSLLPSSLPPVLLDEGKLTQVIVNLLMNAADALQNQGDVSLSAQTTDAELIIQVHDSGPGIPTDVLPHIFQPFFTTKPPGEGTGLGLAICDHIAHQLHGRLSVQTSPQDGTTFLLHLPLHLPGGGVGV